MKTANEKSLQDLIDLLIDGELPEAQRFELLLRLEAEPAGWRQCALTFLEDQMLVRSAPGETATGRLALKWLAPLAVAAALVLSFLLGAGLNGTPPGSGAGEMAQVSITDPEPLVIPDEGVFKVSQLGGQQLYSTREELPPLILEAVVLAGHGVQQLERTVTLLAEDGGTISIPIRETRILDMRPASL